MNGGSGDLGAGWGQQQGHRQEMPVSQGSVSHVGSTGSTQIGQPLGQQVIVGAADFLAIPDDGQYAWTGPWTRCLDHLGCGVLRC